MSDSFDEEFVPEEEAGAGPGALKRLREKLAKAVEEKQEYLDGWQRARADFANYKREEAASQQDKEARIRALFIESILPALDTFEMALRHTNSKDLEIVHKQLLDGLKQSGVERFGATGDTFDPHRYEAIREVPTSDKSLEHTVENIERSGYTVGEKIIRPAQVSVYSLTQ